MSNSGAFTPSLSLPESAVRDSGFTADFQLTFWTNFFAEPCLDLEPFSDGVVVPALSFIGTSTLDVDEEIQDLSRKESELVSFSILVFRLRCCCGVLML